MRLNSSHQCVGRLCILVKLQIGDFILLPGGIGTDTPCEVIGLYWCCADGNLHTTALDVANVGKQLLVEVCSCCCRDGSKQVLSLAVVVINRTCNAVVEESKVNSHVVSLGGLPLQVGIVCCRAVCVDWSTAKHIVGSRLADGVNWHVAIVGNAVLLSGNTVAQAQFEVVHHLLHTLKKRFIRESPCKCHRGECSPACIGAEAR